MGKYPKYKHSGVEWIGEIPAGWGRKKIKTLSEIISKGTTPSTVGKDILDEGEIRYLKSENIVDNNVSDFPRFFIDLETNNILKRSILREGDLLFVIAGASLGKVAILPKELSPSNTNQAVSFIRLKNEENRKYTWYWLTSSKLQEQLWLDAVQSAQPNLSMENLGNFFIPYPPLPEQQQIVTYLDHKTTLIDQIITGSEKKIELLKEQRTATINHAVTKGLNPKVKMKDSGVEWIGEIPSHWSGKKLKFICKITYGISPPDTTYNDGGIGSILINGPAEYSETDFGFTRSIKWTIDPKKFAIRGSLLFCLRGSTTGRMNITHDDVSIGRGVCALNSFESQEFLIYSMFLLRESIQEQISGSTFPSVTKDDVDNFLIPNPPISEQQQIVTYLDQKTKEIDDLIASEKKRIELLKEYRQSLISEVVTGKIKVTNH